jgi:type VI secretion system Hcp family effector
MSAPLRRGLGLALILAGAIPVHARAEILMSVNGPNGPFAGQGIRGGNSVEVLAVALDFAAPATTAAGPVAASALRPVVVRKPVDRSSREFLDALASHAALDVVISIVQKPNDQGLPIRRVVTLSNARVSALQGAMDANGDPAQGLGVETVSFTYERIQIDDDGLRVFSAGP